MELINRLKLPNITTFPDRATVETKGDGSYDELALKDMGEGVIFTTFIAVFTEPKGGIKFTRVSLACVLVTMSPIAMIP